MRDVSYSKIHFTEESPDRTKITRTRMPPVDSIAPGPDTIRVLITTDNHVGYNENDLIRGDDGWKTFQEITYLAKTHDVDMILQGGDLFHVNKPSKKSLYHVMKSLRLNCMGDRPCELELLSDPKNLIDGGFNTVNYEDPNLNVSVPVFAISGNHDDATGDGFLLPLDLLSVSGLINYFGKIPNNEEISVTPLLFQKGTTKLALYGMSNVKDERLHRMFKNGQVKFLRPDVQTDQWFNLLVVHQNHFQHSLISFLPESYLPNFLNFVLWGHEHECIPHPSFNPDTGFDTLQPGSSIATSLSEGETAEKNVFILNIKDKKYSIESIRLQTVRPFVMKEISLQHEGFLPGAGSKDDIVKYLIGEVDKLIEEAKQLFKVNNPDLVDEDTREIEKSLIPLPLVRLRVEYSGGFEIENARRFSNRFVGRIANVNDVIHYYKKKGEKTGLIVVDTKKNFSAEVMKQEGEAARKLTIQEYLKDFLGQANMNIIPEQGMNDMVARYVDQDDKQLINEFVDKTIKLSTDMLLSVDIAYEDMNNENGNFRTSFKNALNTFKKENALNSYKSEGSIYANRRKTKLTKSAEIVNDSEDETAEIKKRATRVKRKPRGKPRASSTYEESAISDDEENEDLKRKPKPKPKLRDRGEIYTEEETSGKEEEVLLSDDDAIDVDDREDEDDYIEIEKPKSKTPATTRKIVSTRGSSRSRSGGAPRKNTKAKPKPTGSLLDDIISLGN